MKALPWVLTVLAVFVGVALYHAFFKQVEIGANGKPVEGGKRMAYRFGLMKTKKAAA